MPHLPIRISKNDKKQLVAINLKMLINPYFNSLAPPDKKKSLQNISDFLKKNDRALLLGMSSTFDRDDDKKSYINLLHYCFDTATEPDTLKAQAALELVFSLLENYHDLVISEDPDRFQLIDLINYKNQTFLHLTLLAETKIKPTVLVQWVGKLIAWGVDITAIDSEGKNAIAYTSNQQITELLAEKLAVFSKQTSPPIHDDTSTDTDELLLPRPPIAHYDNVNPVISNPAPPTDDERKYYKLWPAGGTLPPRKQPRYEEVAPPTPHALTHQQEEQPSYLVLIGKHGQRISAEHHIPIGPTQASHQKRAGKVSNLFQNKQITPMPTADHHKRAAQESSCHCSIL